MGVKTCFSFHALLKVKVEYTDALTYLATHEHPNCNFGESIVSLFIVTTIENVLMPLCILTAYIKPRLLQLYFAGGYDCYSDHTKPNE